MDKAKISIIIPAKNEEINIKEIIMGCREFSDDVIVVDGHSVDNTGREAEGMGARVYLDNRKGKGDALRIGMAQARNDILVFIDADHSHNPKDIPELVRPIMEGRAEHVSGSRMRGGSDELHGDFLKFIRMVGSDVITLAINYTFGVRLTDSQNGFRAIKRDLALSLGLKEDITTIEQEMIIKTLKKGYRIAEIPTHEYARRHGDSHIRLSRVWFRYVYSLIKNLFFV